MTVPIEEMRSLLGYVGDQMLAQAKQLALALRTQKLGEIHGELGDMKRKIRDVEKVLEAMAPEKPYVAPMEFFK